MTHDKWNAMTERAKNVDVGRLSGLGYKEYTTDLNAMHEVEKQIPLAYLEKYWDNLKKICTNPRFLEIGVIASNAISATAAQRAEAFVLTMEPE